MVPGKTLVSNARKRTAPAISSKGSPDGEKPFTVAAAFRIAILPLGTSRRPTHAPSAGPIFWLKNPRKNPEPFSPVSPKGAITGQKIYKIIRPESFSSVRINPCRRFPVTVWLDRPHHQNSCYTCFKYSRTMSAAVVPSPAALETCLVLLSRTSPAANIPGTLVSSRYGSRFLKPAVRLPP